MLPFLIIATASQEKSFTVANASNLFDSTILPYIDIVKAVRGFKSVIHPDRYMSTKAKYFFSVQSQLFAHSCNVFTPRVMIFKIYVCPESRPYQARPNIQLGAYSCKIVTKNRRHDFTTSDRQN